MADLGETERRKRRNRDFAEQLAISADVPVVHMGLFDGAGGFFLEHWSGVGPGPGSGNGADGGQPAEGLGISSLARMLRELAVAPGLQAGTLLNAPFVIGIGAPSGHLFPVMAMPAPTVPDGGDAEAGLRGMDPLLRIGLTFVSGQLGDFSGLRPERNGHLLETAMRVLSVRFAVVDGQGEIDYSANLPQDWLMVHGGFEIAGSRLVARSHRVQKTFLRALNLAVESGQSSIVSIRADGQPMRLVWISALEGSTPPRALVTLGRGGEDPAMREQLLKMSGLTGAERRVAHHVLRGKSLSETARETNLALSTVRSYMKSILAKTSTHRQSEFVSRYQHAVTRLRIVSGSEETASKPDRP